MDSIEKGIQSVDEHTKQAIQKHKDILAKTIFETAQKSSRSTNSFDTNCRKIFTEANTIGKEDPAPFNPHTVVEFRDGKSYQVMDSWDKDMGLLPHRKVMGTYYVDRLNYGNSTQQLYCQTHKTHTYFTCTGCGNNRHMGNHIVCTSNHHPIQYRLSCGCSTNYSTGYAQIYKIPDTLPDNLSQNSLYQRGEERNYFIKSQQTIKFEIDNYLNIFHPQTGLYLMFHKTSFPDVCFYLAREYTQLPDKDYYKIYLSKRLSVINFTFNQSTYQSLDNRDKFLNDINELVPQNYDRIYQLYNNFRKFQSFEVNPVEMTVSEPSDKNILDPKDRIIKGLQLKLNETIKRCEKAESIVSDVVEKYKEKSLEVQALERENNLLELNIREQEDKLHYEIESIKKEMQEKMTEHTERENRDYIDLYKRLCEAEAFGAKAESLGISVSSLQKQLEMETLSFKRLKDINMGLVKQIQNDKDRTQKYKDDNEELIRQLKLHQVREDNAQICMRKLEEEIEAKTRECQILTQNLEKIGLNSGGALENALTDRVSELENRNRTLEDEKQIINIEKDRLQNQFNKVKVTLSNLGF